MCVVGTAGRSYEAGDTQVEFTIMSIAKPFVFALVCQKLGLDEMQRRIGMNATGLAFNSLAAVAHGPGGHTNPMVNS